MKNIQLKKINTVVKREGILNTIRLVFAMMICPQYFTVTGKMRYLDKNKKLILKGTDFIRNSSLELMAYEIHEKNVEGDVAELGVYQGNFASKINAIFSDRTLYLFDTFEGFNENDVASEKKHGYGDGSQNFSNTSVEYVMKTMKKPDKCIVKKGWFPDTTKGLENNKYAFVSIDADLYDPIYEGLKYFYPRLAVGGVIFIHDYNNKGYSGCKEAVRKYCKENNIAYFCLPDICGSAIILK